MITKPMSSLFSEHPFILSEAAICERLRGNDAITLHPTLFNTPLIYDESAAKLLASITHQYIDIAREFAVPITIAAPTWRLDAERVAAADVPPTINRDAVEFVKKIKADSGYELVYLAGLMATKNDCYDPSKPIDKSSYQLNPSNTREAVRELLLDMQEGADILMVKPAEPYLDIIALARQECNLPVAAYQVSGEYSRIWAAASQGWLDLDACALESLLSIKRAGANIIISYFAERIAKSL